MSKISLQMYTMREHTGTEKELAETVERLGEMGFEKLQYSIPDWIDAQAVKRIFDQNGIENDSVYCPSMEIEKNMNKILFQCELFQTDYIRIDSIPANLASSPEGYKTYAHYLNKVSEGLKKQGKKLLYHFHAFEFIRFDDKTGIDIFLSESDDQVIQIIPDTHWIHSGGKNVCEFLEKYKNRYDYIHVKDFGIGPRPERLEMRPIIFAPVGEGNLNWDEIIALCKKNNVKSYAIEQDECYGRNAFDCVESSYCYLRKAGL